MARHEIASSSSDESSSDSYVSSESDSSSSSPSPVVVKRRRVVDKKLKTKKAAKKAARKPTHWMTLVKATFAAGQVKGSTGLTESMKKASEHLVAFKAAHTDGVPSVEVATAWIRPRL
jgi:hypothetical protein